MLSKAIGAAAVAYTLLSLIYGRAEYAAVGPVEFQTVWLETIVPVIAAIVYPILSSSIPGWSYVLKMVGWVMPKKADSDNVVLQTILQLLKSLNDLEYRAYAASDIELGLKCNSMKLDLIERLYESDESDVDITDVTEAPETAGDAE